jgi:hypothetical protein
VDRNGRYGVSEDKPPGYKLIQQAESQRDLNARFVGSSNLQSRARGYDLCWVTAKCSFPGQACRRETCDCVTCLTLNIVLLGVLWVSDASHVAVVNVLAEIKQWEFGGVNQ